MLGSQNQQSQSLDNVAGTITEKYDLIDSIQFMSEVMPGNYEYTTFQAYSNSGGIGVDGSYKVDIRANDFQLVSMNNSFTNLTMTVPITIPSQRVNIGTSESPNWKKNIIKEYAVGFDVDGLAFNQERYESNSAEIININNSRYNWMLLSTSVTDEAKKNSRHFMTADKVDSKNSQIPGVYINMEDIPDDGATINIDLSLSIPLNYFLLLMNHHYYAPWEGTITLELYPTFSNLQIKPVIPDSLKNDSKFKALFVNNGSATTIADCGFYNINTPMSNMIIDNGTSYEVHNQTWSASSLEVNNMSNELARMSLHAADYSAIQARYIQIPMALPVQLTNVKDFNNSIGTSVNSTVTQTTRLTNATSVQLYVKDHPKVTTCMKNPGIRSNILINGKYFPRTRVPTVPTKSSDIEYMRFVNMYLDTVNLNNSLYTSMPNDVRTSVQPYIIKDKISSTGTNIKEYEWTTGDRSKFFYGIPLADSDDFMGGVNFNGEISVESERIGPAYITSKNLQQMVACYTESRILLISPIPSPNGTSHIRLFNGTGADYASSVASRMPQ